MSVARYKWSLLGWSLEYRLKYFERHWCYFLGFGLPAVVLSLVFPKFISLGIFALAFPGFIILAIIAKPKSHVPRSHRKASNAAAAAEGAAAATGAAATGADGKDAAAAAAAAAPDPVLLPQLPIFRGATWLNWWLLQKLQTRNNKTTHTAAVHVPVRTTATATATATSATTVASASRSR